MTKFASAATLAAFQDAVLNQLGASYMDDKGTVFQGNALSQLKNDLTSRYSSPRFTGLSQHWDFTDALAEAGFKVTRARTMRYTRNGQFKPYQECTVVTL